MPDENENEIGLMGGIKLIGETRLSDSAARESEGQSELSLKPEAKRKAAEMEPKALL